jgi:hypothetical protein
MYKPSNNKKTINEIKPNIDKRNSFIHAYIGGKLTPKIQLFDDIMISKMIEFLGFKELMRTFSLNIMLKSNLISNFNIN